MIAQKKRNYTRKLAYCAAVLLILCAIVTHYALSPWGFYWKVSDEEASLRLNLVETAQAYLGCNEESGTHQPIIDQYNAHEPLALGYIVQYSDSWCSTFVSSIAIECNLTDIIPTECGCERHIGLFQDINCWEENDNAIPLPGDLIFYDWDQKKLGDSTGWSDHVGIVVGTKWPFVKVIEGNKEDSVSYRIILLGDIRIRGYAKPDYASLIKKTP